MNREIFFRAKRIGRIDGFHYRSQYQNGDWVYGLITKQYPLEWQDKLYDEMTDIYGVSGIEIDRETVGQFTGLCDKNGKKIFEGDIIHIKCGYGFSAFVGKGSVFFDEKRSQFRVKSVKPSSFDSEKGNVYDECDFTVIDSYEVIGNIYDNPELLEEL